MQQAPRQAPQFAAETGSELGCKGQGWVQETRPYTRWMGLGWMPQTPQRTLACMCEHRNKQSLWKPKEAVLLGLTRHLDGCSKAQCCAELRWLRGVTQEGEKWAQ